MKKLLAICFLLGFYSLHAQNVRLNAYGFYVFDDKVDSYGSSTSYFNTTIKGGLVWGGGLEYVVQHSNGIELLYLRQDTKAPTNYYDVGDKSGDFDVAINWIMLGFNRYQRFENEKIEGYGGLALGAAIFDVKNPNGSSRSATKFGWGLKLGVNIYASEKFGIKLQTSLMSAAQGVGGSLYFGTGGAGAGAGTYSSMLQFGLGGGVVIPFGGHETAKTKPQM
jgi:hypothetical protein